MGPVDALPASTYSFHEEQGALDCATAPCASVLPGAVRFEAVEGKPYFQGFAADGTSVGWVVRSTDVTDRKGYSGKPVVTLVGLDHDGRIAGARVVHHSEPILLLGIPEKKLQDFVHQYVGHHATDPVEIGASGDDGVDAISGATVTVLAENATLLETARGLGTDVGVVPREEAVPGHWVKGDPLTWSELVDEGALGHLVVTADQMGLPPADQPFVDLWFGLADAPEIGIPLLGESTWRWQLDHLPQGAHLLAVFNGGSASFRGSGFVRGGIFDRIRLEQGLSTVIFRDMDYTRVDPPPVADAPELPEAGVFVARELDPGAALTFVFLGSSWNGKDGFSRDFHVFTSQWREPRSIWALDGPDPDDRVWKQAWAAKWPTAAVVGGWMVLVAMLFVGRRFTTGRMERLQRLHRAVLGASFLLLGVGLHVQPSITQFLTIVGSVRTGFDWRLFLSDPVLFVSWIAIAVVSVVWGRGVYCGWICPYGAMSELVYRIAQHLGVPHLELSDRVHQRARYLRYAVLAVLVLAFLWQPETGEKLAEIEPFKSTFYVPVWTRHPALIAWWLVLIGFSATTYRPFCRYLCPMGAALADGSSARVSGPYRRDFCSKCKICTKGCESHAIRPDGTIDPRECLSCMECEANWRDDQVCPPLVKVRRDREKAAGIPFVPERRRKAGGQP